MEVVEIHRQLLARPEFGGERPEVLLRLAATSLKLRAHVASVAHQVGHWQSNKKTKRRITRERLLEKLDFDSESGNFVWKTTYRAGKVAGHVAEERGKKYIRIRIDDELIMAHALVWLYLHGEMPEHEIDHINGNSTDNRPNNLRASNRLKNNSNARRRSDAAEFRAVYLNRSNYYYTVVKYAKTMFQVQGFIAQHAAVAARDFLEVLIPRGSSHGKSDEPETVPETIIARHTVMAIPTTGEEVKV